MSDETDVLAVKNEQRAGAKRASLAALKDKKRPVLEFTAKIGDEKLSFLYRALGSKEWDTLVSAHAPTRAQRDEGMVFNPDTFAPALLAKVCVEPELSYMDWTDLFESPEWSRGELQELFTAAVNVCNQGLDAAPFENA